jgi:hypothetical protein
VRLITILDSHDFISGSMKFLIAHFIHIRYQHPTSDVHIKCSSSVKYVQTNRPSRHLVAPIPCLACKAATLLCVNKVNCHIYTFTSYDELPEITPMPNAK